jgi:hypothetical protein
MDWNALDDNTFRERVRQFLRQHYPESLRFPARRLRLAETRVWMQTLSQEGWIAPGWPVDCGGMGLSPFKQIVLIEEQERYGVARTPDMGIVMIGPLLIAVGSPVQRAKYLPRILSVENIWCQGYSEPGSGSDLASLRCEARLEGDTFVINGRKTWTTLAHDATHMFLLARTDKAARKQQGISFLLVDVASPGVEVRPIRNLSGHEEFCEVTLTDVRVPYEDLVGELNQGWTIAKRLLGFERIFIGSPKQSQYALGRLEVLARQLQVEGDAAFQDTYGKLRMDVLDHAALFMRFAEQVRRGEELGPDVSMLKVFGTDTFARISQYILELAGEAGGLAGNVPLGQGDFDVLSTWYNARPAPIYGGSNEIQRNILAQQVLRLPREA